MFRHSVISNFRIFDINTFSWLSGSLASMYVSFLTATGTSADSLPDQLDVAIKYHSSLVFSDSTKKNYLSHLTSYLKYCVSLGQPPHPTDTVMTMRYLAHHNLTE